MRGVSTKIESGPQHFIELENPSLDLVFFALNAFSDRGMGGYDAVSHVKIHDQGLIVASPADGTSNGSST